VLSGGVQNGARFLVDGARACSRRRHAARAHRATARVHAPWTPEGDVRPADGGLIALWLAHERRSWRWAALASVCLALLIPCYLFY